MHPSALPQRHLVLVGGGHSHVAVLRDLAMRPYSSLRVTLIAPHRLSVYSGMVPGVLAGLYALAEAQIDVAALAARAGAAFIADWVEAIDSRSQRIALRDRPDISYDLISFDIGSQPRGVDRVDSDAAVVLVKPIERAAAELERYLGEPVSARGRNIVVVGGGAGGVELAFALAARLRREGQGHVTLCDSAAQPLAERGQATSTLVGRLLAQRGITFRGGVAVTRAQRNAVYLDDESILPCDIVVWATGAVGPALFAKAALPVDKRGFLLVEDTLRCKQNLQIFAAGDCATLIDYPEVPKAGVYAVRQGPVLAHNLRVAGSGARLRRFRPQPSFLALLNSGDGRAVFSYRSWALHGRWAWWLKDRIDRRFIRGYAAPPLDHAMPQRAVPMLCGGCAAKVGADVLHRVLTRLDTTRLPQVAVGLERPDDAAVFEQPSGTLAVASIDAFPPFFDDLFLVGQVAVINAASDLYAMGAEAAVALALVCLPRNAPQQDEQMLEQFLRGALVQLERLGIALGGGHTIAGEQTIVGFAMHGWAQPEAILRKSGAQPGDIVVLSKPLGTGVILAAARAGMAAAEWTEAALQSMLRSNKAMMHLLQQHGVRACTDVTGFGLAGHLTEMLDAGNVGAQLDAAAVPALPGARDLLNAGWRSSFHDSNRRAHDTTDPLDPLWVDPQTSGGLLAAVPADQIGALRDACATANEPLYVIGTVTEPPATIQLR